MGRALRSGILQFSIWSFNFRIYQFAPDRHVLPEMCEVKLHLYGFRVYLGMKAEPANYFDTRSKAGVRQKFNFGGGGIL